jgi:lactate dehydrogenase-like 2-hydroxyacid dehydrogenase
MVSPLFIEKYSLTPNEKLSPGKWRGQFSLGHDPQGKTLGIIGMGGIGRVQPLT